jgi:multidrug efflux pump subunit AcrB
MKALDFALRFPVAVCVFVTAIALGSFFSVSRMRSDVFPDLNQPVIYVAQAYGGMDPAQMEGLITAYYEYCFLFMNGIDHVESRNMQNLALIKLYFHPGTDMAQAVAEAAIYANRAKAFFPPGTVTPFIMKLDASMVPVAYATLSSDTVPIKTLSDLLLFKVRPKLASLPGTTAPQPFGGSLRTIIVNLDPEKLRSKNLSPNEVASALDKGNTVTPSGNARILDQFPFVSVNSMVVHPKDLEKIPIRPGTEVYLRDLLKGPILDDMDIPLGWALVNGRRAVYMPILKTADASTLTVAGELRDNLQDMRDSLGDFRDKCSLNLVFDQSPYVTGAIGGVVQESIIGAILTGLMVLLFLRDWRSVIVVVITIPLSLMGALIGLWATGQSINLMTLGGLSLSVGILVDEGTVVIENIHTQMGKSPSLARAVFVGTGETVVPILLATLCILAVFVPSFLMEGAARGLFVPLAISVGFAMITAFILSITFVPVLSIWLLKSHGHGHEETTGAEGLFSFARFRRGYAGLVRTLLGRSWLVLGGYAAVAGILLLTCGLQLVEDIVPGVESALSSIPALANFGVGREIAPQVDAGQFQMRVKAPVGTKLEITEDLVRETLNAMKEIMGEDSIEISVAYVGQTAPTFTANTIFLWVSGTDQAIIRIALNEHAHLRVEEQKERLRKELPEKIEPWLRSRLITEGVSPGLAAERAKQVQFSFEPADVVNQVMSFGSPSPVEVVVSGPKQAQNKAFADTIYENMRKIESLRDLQYGQAFGYPRINVEVDRERAGLAHLTETQAASSIIAATASSRYVFPVYWADPESGIGYQVQVQVPPMRMNSVNEVGMIPLAETADGGTVLLRDVAKIQHTTMPQEYDRINQRRIVTLSANVVGEDLGRVSRKIQQAIDAAGQPPTGVKVEVRGQVPPMLQMFSGLGVGMAMAVVVVFLMLTAYFQSPRLAFVSVATTPAVVAGVAFALYITHSTLNIESFMGAIMAVGVAVANAILLVTFAERARQTGMPAGQAARTGAEERLRPILMTSCAMIAGMIPMGLGLGEGGEQSAPLGRAVIGGLGFATCATLLILPTVFTLVMGRVRVGSVSVHPDDPESRTYSPETAEGAGHEHIHGQEPSAAVHGVIHTEHPSTARDAIAPGDPHQHPPSEASPPNDEHPPV